MECMIIFWYFDYYFENCLPTYYPLIFAVFTFTTQSVNTGVYFLVHMLLSSSAPQLVLLHVVELNLGNECSKQ